MYIPPYIISYLSGCLPKLSQNLVDKDGDGFPKNLDCNDNNKNIFPYNYKNPDSSIENPPVEIDGDGVDSNCDGFDNVDQPLTTDSDTDFISDTAVTDTDVHTDVHTDIDTNTDTALDTDTIDLTDTGIIPTDTGITNPTDTGTDTYITVYHDGDDDSFGDPHDERIVLKSIFYNSYDLVLNKLDCDDTNPDINPDANEICDDYDVDEDCDNYADDQDLQGAQGTQIYHIDSDLDNFGDPNKTEEVCDPKNYHTLDNTDCDDTRKTVYPGAQEIDFSGVIEDCDSDITFEGPYPLSNVMKNFLTGSVSDESLTIGENVLASLKADLNRDGSNDYVVGSRHAQNGQAEISAGGVYYVSGDISACQLNDIQRCAYTVYKGNSDSLYLGQSVNADGDIDGDGINDVAVSSYQPIPDNGGLIYLIFSSKLSPGNFIFENDADVLIDANNTVQGFGRSMLIGDFNDDGLNDLIVGVSGTSAVYVFDNSQLTSGTSLLASDAKWIINGVANEQTGVALTMGDFDGDGKNDLVVGSSNANSSLGKVDLIGDTSRLNPGVTNLASVSSKRIHGNNVGDQLGSYPLKTLKDIPNDGDAFDELILGCMLCDSDGLTDNGNAFVFTSSTLATADDFNANQADQTFKGTTNNDYLGRALATGEIDGDGFGDVAITSSGYNNARGNILVAYGAKLLNLIFPTNDSDQTGMVRIVGSQNNSQLGYNIAFHDLNNDNKDEIISGEPTVTNEGVCYTTVNNH